MTEFEKVYQRYFKDVYLYLKGISRNESIAEELTHETFFKAMKSLDHFKGNCDVRVWLCQIAKNTYYTFMNKEKRLTYSYESEKINDNSTTLEEKLIDRDASLKIHAILHEMVEPYKEVFTLRVFGELSFSQIGDIFGKNENWACVTYHRAKLKIREKMEDFYE